jgi:hypothetical protein
LPEKDGGRDVRLRKIPLFRHLSFQAGDDRRKFPIQNGREFENFESAAELIVLPLEIIHFSLVVPE